MNILNITSITELRGGDMQLYTMYNLLKAENDIKQFILCPSNSVLATICETDQANYFTYTKNNLKLKNLIQMILEVCENQAIEILHVHDSKALNAALIAVTILKKPPILVLSRKRNNPIKDKFLNRYKYSHPSIAKIISVSKAVESIFDTIITNKDRLTTIYDAIDVAKFSQKTNKSFIHQEYNLPHNTLLIGNIAGLTDQKDLYTFIDAAKKIKEKNKTNLPIRFVLIGDGPLKNDLTAYAQQNGLEKDLIFMGYRNNVADLLPEFDVFLITSITEGLPLTVYEAMACKIPVVATKAGGIPEVIINQETGFLAACKDYETLSDLVLEAITNKVLIENIKNKAFDLVQKNHDLYVMKANYYSFYKTLLE
ncbi:glycosyltransferase family 4 protein [Flavobacterium restrictum]|uniref:Glycosyltransferase family 4 protein n=1 Tax=Flavobacterium restrictum TaxID=2594428 RepID=A0A553E8H2_9FLAO|nr:glycosyltransferase family 4 protein [Flavobacterium restrictum]TRX41368.1 glycosyltransferase family 4 protein [Flavobacterium restrictum]